MMQEQQGCCVVETTLVVCSGPGDWAWRSRGMGLGLGASAWGLLAVAVKVKPAIVLQILVASDCGHHCYLASNSAYGDCCDISIAFSGRKDTSVVEL